MVGGGERPVEGESTILWDRVASKSPSVGRTARASRLGSDEEARPLRVRLAEAGRKSVSAGGRARHFRDWSQGRHSETEWSQRARAREVRPKIAGRE